ncbi:hypothetical protein CDEST_09788 [Colletotrichum destructivum]|uniref:Aminotransferase-like plant mobile domain-containing protein n=1 Tax=Colletotrichum destructivum TaxID=34406 RepID=A0AAX4IPI4_9PEZI|nr:hypothetical protein CDEST_09788 [Colletotrichum destructivum]
MAHFFMLKIEGRLVPNQMVRTISRFREHLPQDLMPLEFAVLMAFTFWAYARHPVLTTELWAKGPGGNIKKVVPRIDLGVWLTYAPHFVRTHEELGLALYEHPFRFTSNHYEKDQAYFQDSSVVPFRQIDEGEILELIDGMGINLGDFERVIPSSWPGSRLEYPGLSGMESTPQQHGLDRALTWPF